MCRRDLLIAILLAVSIHGVAFYGPGVSSENPLPILRHGEQAGQEASICVVMPAPSPQETETPSVSPPKPKMRRAPPQEKEDAPRKTVQLEKKSPLSDQVSLERLPSRVVSPVQSIKETSDESSQRQMAEGQQVFEKTARPSPVQSSGKQTELAEEVTSAQKPSLVTSPPALAAAPKKSGVRASARPTSEIHPRYPRLSRRKEEEGIVHLKVWVSAEGKVMQVKVEKPSGHQRLDNEAVRAVQRAGFIPAQVNQKPVSGTCILRIRFQLRDSQTPS